MSLHSAPADHEKPEEPAAEMAARLGREHGADGGPPLASEYLGEDEHLWPALGITSPATDENAPERWAILWAYCDAYDQAAERARALAGP